MINIELEATLDKLDYLIDLVTKKVDENSCPNNIKMQIQLAVEEIYINICSYAYTHPRGKVKISFDVKGEPPVFYAQFIDSGVRYNPLENKDPNIKLSAQERDVGGLGVLIAKNSIDTMDYKCEEGKNILIISKAFNQNHGKD